MLRLAAVLAVSWAATAHAGSSPQGAFDLADSSACRVAGWARDPDSTAPIYVHIYRDGDFSTGTFLGAIPAPNLRADLPFADKNHGFDYAFNAGSGLRDGAMHTLYLYSIDATGDPNAGLTPVSRSITCAAAQAKVSVSSFGAVGNGVADDAPAIQAALNAVAVGGEVDLPSGTFMLGSSAGGVETFPDGSPIQSALIVGAPGVHVLGQGATTILKLMAGKKMRALSITSANVTIDSIVVDGNKAGRNGTVGYPGGDVVDGLLFSSHTSNHVTVQSCEVRNGIEDGIGFWKSDDALVQLCSSHDNGTPQAGASGISLSGGARARSLNNTSKNNTIGTWSSFGSQTVTMQNNMFLNNAQEGIIIGGFTTATGFGGNSDFTLTGNTLSGNGSAGFAALSIAAASNGTITGNTIIDNYFDGIALSDQGANPCTTWSITNNMVANTTAARMQKYGLRVLNNSSAISVTGNTFADNGTSLADQVVAQSALSINADWATVNTLIYTTPPDLAGADLAGEDQALPFGGDDGVPTDLGAATSGDAGTGGDVSGGGCEVVGARGTLPTCFVIVGLALWVARRRARG